MKDEKFKRWSKHEDVILKEKYPNTDIDLLCKTFGRTKNSVTSRARYLGFLKTKEFISKLRVKAAKKYYVDLSYFKSVDSREKAYWYGFIWADGSVCNNHLYISVHNKDISILKKFKKHIKTQSPIKLIKNGDYDDMVRICINSKEIIQDLSYLNIIERKTYLDNLPIIDDKYFWSFLLGFFDGDGCFTSLGLFGNSFSICCREIVAIWLKNKLEISGISNAAIYSIKNKENKNLVIHRKSDLIKIYELLYSSADKSIWLKRKYQKFTRFYKKFKYKSPHFNRK